MGQRGEPPSETPSDPVDEEHERSFVERHFWLLLAGALLVPSSAGVAVVYLQYDQVDKALQSVPYVKKVRQWSPPTSYANQVARVLPFMGADTSAGGPPREYGSFTRVKGLVVNPAGSGGNRYLAVSLAFESNSSSVMQELKDKKIVVRDAILTLLSARTVDELSDPDQRDELKRTILKETNRILRRGKVERLYFTEFVLQ
ncbi:MAG: flagellar basal body-associated protein FliL [Salinibacter sp.]